MSHASRSERQYLRFLHRDTPDKLEKEIASFEQQMEDDTERTEWWCTSPGAKAKHLLNGEARRLVQQHPAVSIGVHLAGLDKTLASQIDDDPDSPSLHALQLLPGYPQLAGVWAQTVAMLLQAFPHLPFGFGKSDIMQKFLAGPNATETYAATLASPAMAALSKWKDSVVQEPQRAPSGKHSRSDQFEAERIEAANLWSSWLAYTEVLAESYPQVLDAALLDLGVLRNMGGEKDAQGRRRLERLRTDRRLTSEQSHSRSALSLCDETEVVPFSSVEDAAFEAVHWYDFLVARGRLPALPSMPVVPTSAQLAHDPVLAVGALCVKSNKRIARALGIPLSTYCTPRIFVSSADLKRVVLPAYDAPGHVYDWAVYKM